MASTLIRSVIFILIIGGAVLTLALRNTTSSPAQKFISSLSPGQKAKAMMKIDNETREQWHYFPGSMITRAGIRIGELTPDQIEKLHDLLRHALSKSGYEKATTIIDLEDVLLQLGGNPEMRNRNEYYVAFYGEPGEDVWSWSFEGHHLSLNFCYVGGKVAMTPRFFGASPAHVMSGPLKGTRPLAREEDLAYDLLGNLTSQQNDVAIFSKEALPEIVTENASRISPLEPKGIQASALSSSQLTLLWELIEVYLSAMPEALTRKRSEALKLESMESLYFGWAGSAEPGNPHYYRIQGKSFLIEFDNVQNNANHIHSVWRDFDGDFGRDLIREHYSRDHHH